MKSLALLAIAATLAAAPLPRPYTVEHYDVRLTPDLPAQRIAGEATLTIQCLTERLDAVDLDAGDLEIASVTEGAVTRYFERREKLLIVALATAAHSGDRRTITIHYTAKPAKGLVFFPDQVYTSFFTNDWLPSNDRPDDRSTLRLVIDAPKLKTAASGRFDGQAWIVDNPTPPFLFAFATGEFAETTTDAAGVKLRILGKADVAAPTAAALRFFADRTGKPYEGGVYTQVFTHGGVEQEAVDLTLLPEKYAETLTTHPDDLWLLAHELAHQWYAVAIQCKDWSDFWLNEGFATFMADAFLEAQYGKPRYDKEIASSQAIYDDIRKAGTDRPLSFTDWQITAQASGRIVYHKGAIVLAELRKQLGDAPFWKAVKLYTETRWHSAVVSRDFEAAAERATGKNLSKFFEKWVY